MGAQQPALAGVDLRRLAETRVDHPRCCYDPHYAPAWPAWRFDTILCHSMLNVLLPEEQVQVLMAVGEQDLLSASATVYALLDGAADGPLRALIVPKAHIASYFDLSEKLRTACWLMADRVHWLLAQRGAAEEWRLEVVVGRAVVHANVELGACGQGDKA